MDRMMGAHSGTGAAKGPNRDRIGPRWALWLAWGLWLLVVLVEVFVIAFLLADDTLSTREWMAGLTTWVPFVAFATVEQ